jgi:AraC-like DNA-binding protein
MKPFLEKCGDPVEASYFCYERLDPGFPFEWHYHPEYELTLIVHSHGMRFVGDSIAAYSDGDLVLLGPDLPHTWCSNMGGKKANGRHRAIVIQFSDVFLGERFFQVPEMRSVAHMLKRSVRGLRFSGPPRRQVSPIIDGMLAMEPDQRLMALLSVLHTLSRTTRATPLASRGFRPFFPKEDRQRIDAVCSHINEHFTHEIKHADLARLAHMSPPAFSKFFKKTTGKTVTSYTNELRIGLACRQLIESDHTIVDICYRVGFNNFSNFSRRFMQFKGVAPRAFRRRYFAMHQQG